jgi:hypothetical protein
MFTSKQLFSGEIYKQSSILEEEFGTFGMDKYGDLYRYTKLGAANVAAGYVQTSPTQKTNHHNCAAYAAVTADGKKKKVKLTLGATAAVANEYAGGYLIANDNSPEGEMYRISSHLAADASATLEVIVDRPFLTDITTSSEFTLKHNKYNKSIVGASVTVPIAGVGLIDMTAGYYGWLKVTGVAPCLIGSTTTLGSWVMIYASTPGSVTDTTDVSMPATELIIGRALATGVTGEYQPIDLMLA